MTVINSIQEIITPERKRRLKIDLSSQPKIFKPEVNMITADLSRLIVICRGCGKRKPLPSRLYDESEGDIKVFSDDHYKCQKNFKHKK